jgi:YebC/PmpR family DNA-binding regulatory protein
MAGHSKWKNIAHKKEKTDAQKAKVFTKLSREIIVAVREGGADPAANARLKDCIAKARQNNVPGENIKRIIEKAAGGTGGANYETIQYEGYGPGGTAVIVKTLTDNRNRTAGEMRHYFDKFGGNLGAAGCVSWLFDENGPQYMVSLEAEEDIKKMYRLLEALEDNDDVQEVWHNWEEE